MSEKRLLLLIQTLRLLLKTLVIKICDSKITQKVA